MRSDNRRQVLANVKRQVKSGDRAGAFARLREVAQPNDDFALQARCARLFESMASEELGLQPIRIAMLAGSTVDHFVDVLKWWLARDGFLAEFYLCDYDTIHQTVLNPSSDLYAFEPDLAWLFITHRDVHVEPASGSDLDAVEDDVASAVQEWTALWDAMACNMSCYIIQNNADLPVARVFGNYEAVPPWSRINVLRRFNLRLAETTTPGVTLFDLDHVSSVFGKERWFDARYWYHSKHAFSMDAYGLVACQAARLIAAIKGRARKCLVLDLDNTLWGGVIGDDGLDGILLGNTADGEAFVDFQKYLAALKRRGIVLAVCSKNDEDIARLPFEQHPDMQLRLGDIAVFKANWQNKADNIREIATTLNIGLDSLVFLDDNPAERLLVNELLPDVAVPELPDDPSQFVDAVSSHHFFETVTFSEEDKTRSDLYRTNARRVESRETFTDLSGFLKSLDMVATVGEFDDLHLPRIAQLINKSNQFHLTTTRYSEAEIKTMVAAPDYICRYFRLEDRFGDNGLISAVILRIQGDAALFIDTWVMSCRVLSRTMEEFICQDIVAAALDRGCRCVVGRYIPTKKNRIVADLYERLGFKPIGQENGTTEWELDLSGDLPHHETFVTAAANENG